MNNIFSQLRFTDMYKFIHLLWNRLE